MFTRDDIKCLVAHLKHRRVLLAHACQYVDLGSYLTIGGIPSRAALEAAGLPFTAFTTDVSDRERDVWEKVFANLSDFGEAFARNRRGTPNAYGPIVLHFQPEALLEATDVAITLRSAGEAGYDRSGECLQTLAEVNLLFAEEAPEWTFDPSDQKDWTMRLFLEKEANWLKLPAELQAAFPGRAVKNPEVSCGAPAGFLSLGHTKKILADPYVLGSVSLAEHVQQLVAARGWSLPVEERRCGPERSRMYRELWEIIAAGIPTLGELATTDRFSEDLRGWAQMMLVEKDQDWMFNRYARYLRAGTIQVLNR